MSVGSREDLFQSNLYSIHMRTTQTIHLAANCLQAATVICLMLSGCKKDKAAPPVNNDLFSSVTLVTTGGSFSGPSSAVPDAGDQFLYFTASGPGGAGIFRVPAAGG